MKRVGNIYDKICTLGNLREAHAHAKKGKSRYGNVKMVDRNPDFYCLYTGVKTLAFRRNL